ncbi:DNA repair protein RecO [Corynebacterium sp. 4HC-13]|uniref:DNA repair protein RecO n=1 Tax=Corynebacterium anserum TaxID=2684406 RepID=UPI00163B31FB|nr:DNA repair protein RecO [Corynebacterium anserum]MBC2681147.1 DNA repair protein RecO [Corynebacterium anserum]
MTSAHSAQPARPSAPRRRRGSRPSYRDEAFVLRTYKLGEADLILVLLTAEHGVIRAVAKGARKTTSRFGARLDRFSRVNVQIYPSSQPGNAGLGKLTDAATVATYAPTIVADPDLFFAASALLEMALVFADSDIFFLLDVTLSTLAKPELVLPPVSVVDQFVLHCLEQAGWAPSLVDCAQCGKRGPHRAFHPLAGGAVCALCRPPGAITPPTEAVHALWLLSNRRDQQAGEILRDKDIAAAAHELLLSHVRNHVEVPCKAYGAL